MNWLGDYPEDFTTVPIVFTTHDANGAPLAPLTAFEAADVTIYKNGSTPKSTTNGITMTSPLNSKTGLHAVIIDTSNDTGDAGFWTTGGGSVYSVVLDPDTETVNGQTVRKEIGTFGICLSPALRPATAGRTLVVDAAGLADANVVKVGPTGSGTAQTARDIGASVLLSSGAGTGQLDFTSGVVKANATQWLGGTIPAVNVTGVPLVDAKYLLGTAFSTPTVAGIPNVNVKTWNDFATVALPLVPTTAGRTLDVSATGEAGVDWANVGSPTTANALTGTTIASTQKVDVETIKTNPVVNGGTVTFPPTATLASTTNITAGTITTVTNLTNAATNGDLTTAMKASVNAEADTALADYDAPTHAELTAELAAADDAALAAIAALNNLSAAQVRTELAVELARIDAAISSRLAGASYTAPDNSTIAAIAGYVDTEVAVIIAALALVKAQTDKLTFTVANQLDSNVQYVNDVQVNGNGSSATPWGP